MTFIPELIIPRHERILSSPKLDNSFEIVNARDEPRNDASPLFLPAPPLVVPIRWNSTLPLAFTSTLVFYRPNKAEQTTTQTRRTTTARAKRTGGIGYAVIDTRDHRTLRGRKRCAPPPPPPSSSLPRRWISRAFVESMAPLSPLFYRIHVCDPTYEKYHSFVQWLVNRRGIHVLDSFKAMIF